MGYLVRFSYITSKSVFLAVQEPSLSLGINKIGLPQPYADETQVFLKLLNVETLREKDPSLCRLRVESSELICELGQVLVCGSSIQFHKSIRLSWRDLTIDLVHIKDTAFLLAKLNSRELLDQKPAYVLKCNSKKLSLPVFLGTSFSIGSHPNDAIRISELLAKPRHAFIQIDKNSSTPKISAHLGKIETWVENEKHNLKLLPSRIEFTLEPIIT